MKLTNQILLRWAILIIGSAILMWLISHGAGKAVYGAESLDVKSEPNSDPCQGDVYGFIEGTRSESGEISLIVISPVHSFTDELESRLRYTKVGDARMLDDPALKAYLILKIAKGNLRTNIAAKLVGRQYMFIFNHCGTFDRIQQIIFVTKDLYEDMSDIFMTSEKIVRLIP